MHFLSQYCSSEEDVDVSETTDDSVAISRRANRQVYLITLSQASMVLVPTRQDFADAVIAAYQTVNAQVMQWCVSKECHKQRSEGSGYHYHMAVKCDRAHRWLPIATYLRETRDLHVHFSDTHVNYYSAYSYVVKEDRSPIHSPTHPDLSNQQPPRTTIASQTRVRERNSQMGNSSAQHVEDSSGSDEDGSAPTKRQKKPKKLQPSDIFDIVVPRNIKTKQELLVFAKTQKDEGKTDLWEFCFNRSSRVVTEAIENAWSIENEIEKCRRKTLGRIGILQEYLQEECIDDCNGKWLVMAKEIIQANDINLEHFAEAIYSALRLGRRKNNNIYVFGPANCGKSFLFKPLSDIYNTFTNPATGTYAWVGIEEAEVVFLNDFRWSKQLIPWNELLLMLEGETISIPAPKTHFRQDLRLITDCPIFATSKYPLTYVHGGSIDHRETDMMSARWVYFELFAQIPRENQVQISPCAHCFARFVLEQLSMDDIGNLID